MPLQVQSSIYVCTQFQQLSEVIHNIDIVMETKYLTKLKWCIHCSFNSLLFRHSTVFVFKLQYFRPQNQLTEFLATLRQQQNDNMFRLVSLPKERPGTRTVTHTGQLRNDCPLFVWQNQGNFIQSVISHVIDYLLGFQLLRPIRENSLVCLILS